MFNLERCGCRSGRLGMAECVLSFRIIIKYIYIFSFSKRPKEKKYTRKDESSDGVPVCTKKLVKDVIA